MSCSTHHRRRSRSTTGAICPRRMRRRRPRSLKPPPGRRRSSTYQYGPRPPRGDAPELKTTYAKGVQIGIVHVVQRRLVCLVDSVQEAYVVPLGTECVDSRPPWWLSPPRDRTVSALGMATYARTYSALQFMNIPTGSFLVTPMRRSIAASLIGGVVEDGIRD
uniref:Uncharacterized protein n=1 Tax=Odontella aurita TaxID=265563 RepID=A0A7S4ML55_9STRA